MAGCPGASGPMCRPTSQRPGEATGLGVFAPHLGRRNSGAEGWRLATHARQRVGPEAVFPHLSWEPRLPQVGLVGIRAKPGEEAGVGGAVLDQAQGPPSPPTFPVSDLVTPFLWVALEQYSRAGTPWVRIPTGGVTSLHLCLLICKTGEKRGQLPHRAAVRTSSRALNWPSEAPQSPAVSFLWLSCLSQDGLPWALYRQSISSSLPPCDLPAATSGVRAWLCPGLCFRSHRASIHGAEVPSGARPGSVAPRPTQAVGRGHSLVVAGRRASVSCRPSAGRCSHLLALWVSLLASEGGSE